MGDILTRLRDRARRVPTTIALPEAEDPRVLEAALQARRENLCEPLLVGKPERIRAAAASANLETGSLSVVDPDDDADFETYTAAFLESIAERGLEIEAPRELLREPIYYAAAMTLHGRVGGAVMGAVVTTRDTLRAALRVVGLDRDHRLVTSCFLMTFEDRDPLIYADCGVVPAPTVRQLVSIARLAASTYRLLLDAEPRVALLSFSTHGSAQHPSLEPVRGAVASLRQLEVDFEFDGELQVDAALVPTIAARKAPGSSLAGRANVLIFPDLNSGNIAYKLTERLAGARAIGPLLRGLGRPIHDLSRGCSVEDILDTLAITAIEAEHRRRQA